MARLDRRFTDAISVVIETVSRFRFDVRRAGGNISAGQLTDSLLRRDYHAA